MRNKPNLRVFWAVSDDCEEKQTQFKPNQTQFPRIKQVKFHNLVVYKNTKLAVITKKWEIPTLQIPKYIEILANLLPHLRGDIVITRLFTSNIRRSQIALGEFTGNKTKWMNELRKYIYKNNIVQGSETCIKYDFKMDLLFV